MAIYMGKLMRILDLKSKLSSVFTHQLKHLDEFHGFWHHAEVPALGFKKNSSKMMLNVNHLEGFTQSLIILQHMFGQKPQLSLKPSKKINLFLQIVQENQPFPSNHLRKKHFPSNHPRESTCSFKSFKKSTCSFKSPKNIENPLFPSHHR